MPIYDEELQTIYRNRLGQLLVNYGVDVSPVQNNPAFNVDFFDLIIAKDRLEFIRLLSFIKSSLSATQYNNLKSELKTEFLEYTDSIEEA